MHKTLCRCIPVVLVTFFLIPMAVHSQQTAPVTIIVQFEGLPPFGGTGNGNLAFSSLSAAGETSQLVFKDLVLPGIKTRLDKETEQEEAAQTLPRKPRTFGGTLRYEHVDFDEGSLNLDGDIFSTNLHMAWDIENFSVGVLIPYSYLSLKSFDASLIGPLLFGQYSLPFKEIYTLGLTVNGNYMYTAINNNFPNVNTYGGGISLSLSMDKDLFVLEGAVSYQYNHDDSDSVNNSQHLLKIGANVGVRLGKNVALNLFSIWTYDPTNYQGVPPGNDNNYFDLGLEAGITLSRLWKLHGGYKKVIGLDNFDSNMIYLGTLLKF